MTARLELRGKLGAVGNMEDMETEPGDAGVTIHRTGAPNVHIIGLTDEECRVLAQGFASLFTIHFTEQA